MLSVLELFHKSAQITKNDLFISSRWVVALSAAGANSSSTRSGAGTQLGPGAPVPIVALRLLAGSPDAVTFEAPLQRKRSKEGGKNDKSLEKNKKNKK